MEHTEAGSITALLLGPGGALLIMVVGGGWLARWLIARLEKADEERKTRDTAMQTLVADNTRAMLAMEAALGRLCDKVQGLTNGLAHREVTDPGLRVVGSPEKRE